MAMNCVRYMEETQGHNSSPVLGSLRTFLGEKGVKLGQNWAKMNKNAQNCVRGAGNDLYPSPLAMNCFIYFKDTQRHDSMPLQGLSGPSG